LPLPLFREFKVFRHGAAIAEALMAHANALTARHGTSIGMPRLGLPCHGREEADQ